MVLEVTMSPDPAAGTEVAGYRIVERAGSGGMGVVYRAEETGLGDRPGALKLLPPALADDPDFRARFLREMRVAAAIDHPNIVPIYRAGEDRGLLYLAMRYVHASDLRRVMETEGRLDPARTLSILDPVTRDLARPRPRPRPRPPRRQAGQHPPRPSGHRRRPRARLPGRLRPGPLRQRRPLHRRRRLVPRDPPGRPPPKRRRA